MITPEPGSEIMYIQELRADRQALMDRVITLEQHLANMLELIQAYVVNEGIAIPSLAETEIKEANRALIGELEWTQKTQPTKK
jgi:hypothetical protein